MHPPRPPRHRAPVEELLALAIQFVNAGQQGAAMRLVEQAAATHPPHPAVLQLTGWLRLQSGQADAAAELAEASLALRPEHPPTVALACDAWFQCALRRQDAGDLDGASAALRRLLRRDPARAEAEVNLGIVLQEAGQIDEAMAAYGRAYRLREDTFGRIAHALANAAVGRVWLDLAALRQALATPA